VLQGQPTLDYSRDGLPAWNYARHGWCGPSSRSGYEIYTANAGKAATPGSALPLAPNERDVRARLAACLQPLLRRGGATSSGSTTGPRTPAVPLGEEDHRWLDALLTARSLRSSAPTYDQVARAAYRLWEQEGRPHGRDQEHWYQALEQLRPPAGAESALERKLVH